MDGYFNLYLYSCITPDMISLIFIIFVSFFDIA